MRIIAAFLLSASIAFAAPIKLLSELYARRHDLRSVDWIVHALTCAKPNLKLRRVLVRKGFVIRKVRGDTEAYFLRHELPHQPPASTIPPALSLPAPSRVEGSYGPTHPASDHP